MFGVIGSYERRVVTGHCRACRRAWPVFPPICLGVILDCLTIRCGVGDRRGVGVTNKLRYLPIMAQRALRHSRNALTYLTGQVSEQCGTRPMSITLAVVGTERITERKWM
jgi:hypothetical protein